MVKTTLVYWYGIVGIAGKGANWSEPYNPDRTVGELIQAMTAHRLGEQNKRIEIFKHQPGRLDRFDPHDCYWPHQTTLSDYVQAMGGLNGDYVMLVYVIV